MDTLVVDTLAVSCNGSAIIPIICVLALVMVVVIAILVEKYGCDC